MTSNDDMSAFEEQLKDVEDPSPFEFNRYTSAEEGVAIGEHVDALTKALLPEIVRCVNEGKPGIVAFIASNGSSITATLFGRRSLVFAVDRAADQPPFIDVVTE